jgi:hypothetical protein
VLVATARLDLVPLPPALVAALVGKDLDAARALAPFPVDDSTFEGDEHVLARRHAQLTADPTEEPWLYRVALLRETGRVVGRIGFHAPPETRPGQSRSATASRRRTEVRALRPRWRSG